MNRRVYTQGLNRDGTHSGDFEPVDLGMLSFDSFMAIVRALPVPAESDSRPYVCPPAVGFSEDPVCPNVCRIEEGSYFIFDGNRESSRLAALDEVEEWARFEYEDK